MKQEINFYCRECGNGILLSGPPFLQNSSCAPCEIDYPLKTALLPEEPAPLEICPRCEGKEFYIQKDFNRKLGLIIAILAALVIYLIFGLTWKSLVGLMLIAALDAALYRVLPLITICYRCKTIYRGFQINPSHQAFDMHIAEHHRRNT